GGGVGGPGGATGERGDVAGNSGGGDGRAGFSAIGIRGEIARGRRTRESRIGLARKIRAIARRGWAAFEVRRERRSPAARARRTHSRAQGRVAERCLPFVAGRTGVDALFDLHLPLFRDL